MTHTAIEFFSGIGAFAEASRGSSIHILRAFDQSSDANDVYELNFGARPSSRNLDTICPSEIPRADIWWMSPPCKPYSVRGNRRDEEDPRSLSLRRLIDLLSCEELAPHVVLMENVIAFENSVMHSHLNKVFEQVGYDVHLSRLCSTDFGVPMNRPRLFITAVRREGRWLPLSTAGVPTRTVAVLGDFLSGGDLDPRLLVDDDVVAKYASGLNVIDPREPGSKAICFTSGYRKSLRASGSFVREGSATRRFSPDEILALLGFSKSFKWPDQLSLDTRWRLVGNSVDVRCIRHLLGQFLAQGINVPQNG